MKIILLIKHIYSELIKDLFKILKIFFLIKKITVKNPIGKILINNEYHEDFSWINYLIGHILKLRGYEVKFLVCNGNHYCERMSHTFVRPNCKLCFYGNVIRLKSFGHDYITSKKTNSLNDIKISNLKDFDYSAILSENQSEHIVQGVNLSNLINVSFLHYFKGKVKLCEKSLLITKKIFLSAVQNLVNFSKVIKDYNPQKIITINGKNIQTGTLYELSKYKNIDSYTWDVFNQGFKCMFSKNEIAHNQNISKDLWLELSKKTLSNEDKLKVKDYMRNQLLGLNTTFKFHDDSSKADPGIIFNLLGLDSRKKIISIFPNQDWDSTALCVDDVYKNQFDFLENMILLSRDFSDYNFVLRPHPVDSVRSKHIRSTRPFNIYLNEKFQDEIPKNFLILKPETKLNSYMLAKISSHRIVYASTLGLEFSFLRLKTIVAGDAFYKNRGFTIDLKNKNDLQKILKENISNPLLDDKDFDLLEKFIFISKFRKLFDLPIFEKTKFPFSKISNNIFLSNKCINNIADYVLDKRNYLDLDK